MRMCTVVDASEFAILYCGDEASKSERKREMEWNGMGWDGQKDGNSNDRYGFVYILTGCDIIKMIIPP